MLESITKTQPVPQPVRSPGPRVSLSPAYSRLEALTLQIYDRYQGRKRTMPLVLAELWSQAEFALKFGDDDYMELIHYLFRQTVEEVAIDLLPTVPCVAVG